MFSWRNAAGVLLLMRRGISLEHTEVGVILTGSEEAGLRGAKAWATGIERALDHYGITQAKTMTKADNNTPLPFGRKPQFE